MKIVVSLGLARDKIGSPRPPAPLVARAQGGLTLGPEGGELGAEKYSLGM
jgi:hypothetical protein